MSASIVPRSLPSSAPSSDFEVVVADSVYETEPRFETMTIEEATAKAGRYDGQPKPGAAQKAGSEE